LNAAFVLVHAHSLGFLRGANVKNRTAVKSLPFSASPEIKPITVSFQTAIKITGLGLTTLWALAKANRIELVRVGRRTLIKFASLEKLLSGGGSVTP
jgi:excisionase family DNA binding protein